MYITFYDIPAGICFLVLNSIWHTMYSCKVFLNKVWQKKMPGFSKQGSFILPIKVKA